MGAKKNRRWVLFLTILFIMAMFGCSYGNKEEDGISDFAAGTVWNSRPNYVLQGTSNDKGYYFTQRDQYLSFLDTVTGKSTVLCSRSGCKHDDSSCYAYTFEARPYMFFEGNHLYTIESGKDRGCHLIRRDADGANREDVMVLLEGEHRESGYVQMSGYKVSGKILYFIGSIYGTPKEDNAMGEPRSSAIYRVDLQTYQQTKIYELKETGCELIAANEKQLIFDEWPATEQSATIDDFNSGKYQSKEFLSKIQMTVKLWDNEKNEVKVLFADNRWEFLSPIAAYKNVLYYIKWDNEHSSNSVYQISIDSGERKKVLDLQGEIINFVTIDEDTIMLMSNNQDSKEMWKIYSLKDFIEVPSTFLPRFSNIVQSMENGYIVTRVLEKEGEDENFMIKKMAYSYISKADAEKGVLNFRDFYIQVIQ